MAAPFGKRAGGGIDHMLGTMTASLGRAFDIGALPALPAIRHRLARSVVASLGTSQAG